MYPYLPLAKYRKETRHGVKTIAYKHTATKICASRCTHTHTLRAHTFTHTLTHTHTHTHYTHTHTRTQPSLSTSVYLCSAMTDETGIISGAREKLRSYQNSNWSLEKYVIIPKNDLGLYQIRDVLEDVSE